MKARVRELLHAVPFRPFVIHMVDGRNFQIEDPSFVMASPKENSNVIVEESTDRMHYLKVSLIAGVEVLSDAGRNA